MVGPPGAGKSTLAAAFGWLGYPVLSDDVAALDERDGQWYVRPAYPQVRLWPESVKLLFGSADALRPLTPNWNKRGLSLLEHGYCFEKRPHPIAAVYVLGERADRAEPHIERMHGRELLRTLLANTYVGYVRDETLGRQEFSTLARLAHSVPVRTVLPPDNPSRLCDAIIEDCEALGCIPSPRYSGMIADTVRTEASIRALRETITPDSVVVDIGTGTGIFALLACRLGARRIDAIEPDDAIQVAQAMAVANGCSDRIEFIQDLSTKVSLPERADVIVSDIGGVLPWFRSHILSIVDARRRFLAPGGSLIPRQDTAWAAIVEAPEWYARQNAPSRGHTFDLDMEVAWRFVSNTFSRTRVTGQHLMTQRQRWATLDYNVVDHPNVNGFDRMERRACGSRTRARRRLRPCAVHWRASLQPT